MAQDATIESLIVSAANGAAAGLKTLKDNDVKIVLKEFEIEVTYSCETEFTASAELKFKIWKASFKATTGYRQTTTYGLKVKFLFVGPDEENP